MGADKNPLVVSMLPSFAADPVGRVGPHSPRPPSPQRGKGSEVIIECEVVVGGEIIPEGDGQAA